MLRDCRDGAIDAAATGAVFSAGGRIVGEGLEAGARLAGDLRPAARAADQTRTGRQALPAGTNPVAIGPAGNPGALDSTAPTRFSVDSSGQATDLTGFSTNPDTITSPDPPHNTCRCKSAYSDALNYRWCTERRRVHFPECGRRND